MQAKSFGKWKLKKQFLLHKEFDLDISQSIGGAERFVNVIRIDCCWTRMSADLTWGRIELRPKNRFWKRWVDPHWSGEKRRDCVCEKKGQNVTKCWANSGKRQVRSNESGSWKKKSKLNKQRKCTNQNLLRRKTTLKRRTQKWLWLNKLRSEVG